MKNRIEWLGHATVLIRGERTVMVDPWKVSGGERVDLVLVTHGHFDHCSPEDVAKVSGPQTEVVAPADAAAKLGEGVKTILPGEAVNVAGVKVEAVPAYNVGKSFHPKDNRWVGYVVTMGGERVYVAGDTDRTAEMDAVKADVALLPVGGTYTMTAEEAAGAADAMGVSLAIPIHFGDVVGSEADARRFEAACNVPVKVLRPGESA